MDSCEIKALIKVSARRRTEEQLTNQLNDLLEQWRETARLYDADPEMREAASGYRECIQELEEVLSGELSAIEKIKR